MPTNNPLANTLPIVRKARVIHGKAHWRDLISEYEGSSLTQQAFRQQHKISTSKNNCDSHYLKNKLINL